MGRVKKGVQCSVKNCDKPAVRSLNSSLAEKAKLDVEVSRLNRVYICDEHYKIIKKLSKKDRKMEKWKKGFI
ncbi:MAG: hypothetical protein ACTSYQ_00125 [Candidatus Odinarchaeia archaeon]